MQSRAVLAAAHTLGLELRVLNASTEDDLDSVFANLVHLRADGLVIGGGSFFFSRIKQLAALAIRHAVPAVFLSREFVAAGGLLSYGTEVTDAYRLAGMVHKQCNARQSRNQIPKQLYAFGAQIERHI